MKADLYAIYSFQQQSPCHTMITVQLNYGIVVIRYILGLLPVQLHEFM